MGERLYWSFVGLANEWGAETRIVVHGFLGMSFDNGERQAVGKPAGAKGEVGRERLVEVNVRRDYNIVGPWGVDQPARLISGDTDMNATLAAFWVVAALEDWLPLLTDLVLIGHDYRTEEDTELPDVDRVSAKVCSERTPGFAIRGGESARGERSKYFPRVVKREREEGHRHLSIIEEAECYITKTLPPSLVDAIHMLVARRCERQLDVIAVCPFS